MVTKDSIKFHVIGQTKLVHHTDDEFKNGHYFINLHFVIWVLFYIQVGAVYPDWKSNEYK